MIARLALAVALIGGAWIRLAHVETKSLSHPEMWAPLIPVPWELADPGMRATLYEAVVHNLMADTHPPGYTIAMWLWMKIAGTSAWALRAPSITCGLASVWLLFAIARKMGSRAPWLAPLLLAFNGYTAMWSTAARMYAPAMFAVLLAAWMLMLLEERWRDWLAVLYSLVLVAGCSLHVYGWIFAGTHLLWSAPRNRRAAWWQLLAMIVASPLLSFAAYQSFHPVAELSRNPLPFLVALAGFGIALPSPEIVDVFDPAGEPLPWNGAVSMVAAAAGVLLAWTGWHSRPLAAQRSDGSPPAKWFLPAAAFSCAIVWIFVSRIAHPHEGIHLAQGASVIPWLLAAAWIILPRIPPEPGWPTPLFFLAAGIAVLSLITLAIPMATPRGAQLFSPFVLLLIAEGIGRITNHRPWTAPAFAAALLVICWFSVSGLAARQVDPIDFRSFAQEVEPHLQPGDTILWRRGWDSTPMLFHLPPDRFRYSTVCAPSARIWEFRLYGQPLPEALRACIAGREPEIAVQRGPAIAIRYRAPAPPAVSTRPPQ